MNINEPAHKGLNLPFMRGKSHSRTSTTPSSASMRSNRLPFLGRLPSGSRNHFVAGAGEFAGTFLFLFFAFSGTQVANVDAPTVSGDTVTPVNVASDTSKLLYISLCFGFSLAVNAWVFFRISGGLFNPAVTMGMCLVGALPWFRGLVLFIAQMLGATSAAAVCLVLFPGDLNVRTSLGGGTSIVQGLFIEMFLTAQLVFTIFMLAAEKHKGTFIAPVGIGLALFVAELTGVYFTGGSVNPARSFGPSAVTRTFHAYHWIYWVGPILGSLLASAFYKFIKMLEYETANPDQDAAKVPFNPDIEAAPESHVNFLDGGSEDRPRMTSPIPPPPDEQYAGLQNGGMHVSELEHKPSSSLSPPRSAMKVGREQQENRPSGHDLDHKID